MRVVDLVDIDVRIIGEGARGDKAQQLIDKTAALRQIGFYTPRRTVLAEGFFDGFFQQNNMGRSLRDIGSSDDLESRIRESRFPDEEDKILRQICSSYGGQPLAIRSSAAGDARGTGIYKSAFCENVVGQVTAAVKQVLASYFSKNALLFRRDAKTGEGFAVLIEPIIGQELVEPVASTHLFASLLSGFGYTSTSRGDGYIGVVPGLGGGVGAQEYERLTWKALRQFGGDLGKYIEFQRDEVKFDVSAIRYSLLLRTTPGSLHTDYNVLAYLAPEFGRSGTTCNFGLPSFYLDDFMDAINMQPLFTMMERAETAFKKPQYFEWALTRIGGKTQHWITQIADVDPVRDLSEFVVPDNLIFTAHTVKGTGIRTCNRIAVCDNPSDVTKLADFNGKSNDYVLLYGSRLMSGALTMSFQYGQISNASVFLEIPNNQRTVHPVAHFQGIVDMTHKLFGVLDYHDEHGLDWDAFKAKVVEDGGMEVYQGNVKVIASERQDRMYVAALD